MTLRGGLAKGGNSGVGGGGAGLGGAIFNQGLLVLERVTLSANVAHGGNTAPGLPGGGGIGSPPLASGAGGGFGGPFSPAGAAGGVARERGGGGGGGFRAADRGGAQVAGGRGGGPETGSGGRGGGSGAESGNGSGSGAFALFGELGGDGGGFGFGGGGGGDGGAGGGGGVGGGGGGSGSGGFAGGGGGGGFGGGGGGGVGAGGGGGFGGGGGSAGGSGDGPGGFGGGGSGGDVGGGGAGMGGAIFNMQGTVSLSEVTLAANRAVGGSSAGGSAASQGQGLGGAIFNSNGVVTIDRSTLAGNVAAQGGSGVYGLVYDAEQARFAITTVRNSVLWDGAPAVADAVSDKPATVSSGATNMGVVAVNYGAAGNIVGATEVRGQGTTNGSPSGADPLLDELAFNGGPGMQTVALRYGSAAIDAAGACLGTDARGVLRPFGAACDLGALEMRLPTATTGAASAVAHRAAGVQGTINPRGVHTSYRFEYGKTTAYGSRTPPHDAGDAKTAVAVSTVIAELSPSTTYHYRLIATAADGTVHGQDRTFTTKPAPASDTKTTADANKRGAPRLTSLRMSPNKTQPRRAPRVLVRFRLSEPAIVTLVLARALPGRRSAKRCVAPSRARKGRRCTRLARIAIRTQPATAAGNALRLRKLLAARRLTRGTYRLTATATDTTNRRSLTKQATLRIT